MKRTGILGLEIHDVGVRYCYACKQGKKVVLKTGEAPVRLQITETGGLAGRLQEILQQEGILPKRITLTLTHRSCVVHQLVLPKMPRHEIAAVVESEVDKIPFFRNREFDTVFRVDPINRDKIRVVFGAVDHAFLEYVIQEIQSLKIPFRDIEIAPLNFPQLQADVHTTAAHGALLIIHDRQSHFLIQKRGAVHLFYVSGIGIEHLISEEGQVLDHMQMGQLIGEVQRVMKSFLIEHKDEKVEHFWLIWPRGRTEVLSKHLAARLERRIEPVDLEGLFNGDITSHEAGTGEAATVDPIYCLAGFIPLCHERHVKPRVKFDALFSSYHLKKYLIKSTVVAAVYLIVMFIGFGKFALDFYRMREGYRQEISAYEQAIENIQEENAALFEKYQEYQTIRKRLLAQATAIRLINRVDWTEVLSVVASEIPEDLSLTSFEMSEHGAVRFEGESFQMEGIADLMRRVEASRLLDNPQFDYLREDQLHGGGEKERKIFNFGIQARLSEASRESDASPAPADGSLVANDRTAPAPLDQEGPD